MLQPTKSPSKGTRWYSLTAGLAEWNFPHIYLLVKILHISKLPSISENAFREVVKGKKNCRKYSALVLLSFLKQDMKYWFHNDEAAEMEG